MAKLGNAGSPADAEKIEAIIVSIDHLVVRLRGGGSEAGGTAGASPVTKNAREEIEEIRAFQKEIEKHNANILGIMRKGSAVIAKQRLDSWPRKY